MKNSIDKLELYKNTITNLLYGLMDDLTENFNYDSSNPRFNSIGKYGIDILEQLDFIIEDIKEQEELNNRLKDEE